MKKYAKIINEETKLCEVGLGTNSAFYQSIGMTEMEVEQAYDGNWYVLGFAPEKPVEEQQAEVRAVRNSYLEKYVDPKQLVMVWDGLSIDERNTYAEYRKYLLDYTEDDEWWLENPLTLDEWLLIGTDEVSISKMETVDEDLTENIIDDTVIMDSVDEIGG
jgi:hypothetical protein